MYEASMRGGIHTLGSYGSSQLYSVSRQHVLFCPSLVALVEDTPRQKQRSCREFSHLEYVRKRTAFYR